jgi:hypothetical protein
VNEKGHEAGHVITQSRNHVVFLNDDIEKDETNVFSALVVWMGLSSGQARDGIGWPAVRVGAERDNLRLHRSREVRLDGFQSRDQPQFSSRSRDLNLSISLSRAIHLSAERRLGFRFWTQHLIV